MIITQGTFDLLNQLQTLAQSFLSKVPSLLGALVLFIVGWLIARLVRSIVARVLKGLHIDKLADRLNEIDIVEKSNVRIVPSAILSKIVYYIVLLIFTIAATDVLGMPEVSELVSQIINYIPVLISAMILLVIGLIICDMIRKAVLTTCNSLGIPSAKLIASFIFYFLLINVVLVTLKQAGIDTDYIASNISIILGGIVLAFAMGYGLASRNIFSNMLSSFYEKDKFHEGDRISIEGHSGTIEQITKSSVVIKTGTGKVFIPLQKFSQTEVELHD